MRPDPEAQTCPVSMGGGTRRVRLVWEEGRDVSGQYGREGGDLGRCASRQNPVMTGHRRVLKRVQLVREGGTDVSS